jgi:hypothetical protein
MRSTKPIGLPLRLSTQAGSNAPDIKAERS